MSEILNNNSELLNDAVSGETEYPPFDQAAAKAAREKYKLEHPSAVDDIDRARDMAEAGNRFRTMAAQSRKDAESWQRASEIGAGNSIADSFAKGSLQDAETFDKFADEQEESAGEYYDVEQLIKRLEESKKNKVA